MMSDFKFLFLFLSLDCDGYYSNNFTKCPSSFRGFDTFHLQTWLTAVLYFLCFGATWTWLYSEKMTFTGQWHVWIPWVDTWKEQLQLQFLW